MAPRMASAIVVNSVSLECRDSRARIFTRRSNPKITGKPRLPRKTPAPITERNHGSVANGSTPSTVGTKPVFVKALAAK
jgi:hypothetical protein